MGKRNASVQKPQGNILGIPYDFRRPTKIKVLHRIWNKNDDRIFTPKVFGLGWTINFFQLFSKLGLVR